jgi:hypothetical protein
MKDALPAGSEARPSRSGAVIPSMPDNPLRRAFHAAVASAVPRYWWSDAERGLDDGEARKRQERLGSNSLLWPAELPVARARVVREGREQDIPAREVVPGDLVKLLPGQEVPADVRLLHCDGLVIDERGLGGQTAAEKDAVALLEPGALLVARPTMAFLGTMVVRGQGRGIVCNTAMHTELGIRLRPAVERPEVQRRRGKAPLVLAVLATAALVVALIWGHPDPAAWAALVLAMILPPALLRLQRTTSRTMLERTARPLRLTNLPRLTSRLATARLAEKLVIVSSTLMLVALGAWGMWHALLR